MTPGARGAAAIDILDDIRTGTPSEAALTRWARGNRYAGSKDRAAVRDLVFDVVRHWRSDAVRGGGESGRQRLIGRLRGRGQDVDAIFSGEGYAPSVLTDDERTAGRQPVHRADQWDLPEWLLPEFERSLGNTAAETAHELTQRAPVTLRVNETRATKEQVQDVLRSEGIETAPNPVCDTALTVTENARRLRNSRPFSDGWFEFQDAASQAVVAGIPMAATALDYCAGGGGKALALAARGFAVTAHDANLARMTDIPTRAARLGLSVDVSAPGKVHGVFDRVLVDVPCSGSGSWRRAPDGKWRLTAERLEEIRQKQVNIALQASDFVSKNGILVYATCSIFEIENQSQVSAVIAQLPGWACVFEQQWRVTQGCDGFYVAHLKRV
ncbi:MAG: RsmB/NOP family class I SAM-dependent RNA methyltransferase [Rhodobacteraceae bacterium]|nr:RsmB/NOP family class I SAM-dependent RNA methyltransferase [Paracoccaceae bacterium]